MATMHKKVSHRLHFVWGPFICTPKGLLTTLTTQNIFISSFNKAILQPTAKIHNEHSNWCGRSSTRKIKEEACKRIRRMKPAEEDTGALYGGRAIRANIKKINGLKQLAWLESPAHTENRGGFAKE